MKKTFLTAGTVCLFFMAGSTLAQSVHPQAWPTIQSQTRPWTRWWWHGSSVTREGIRAELEAFQKAGLGGVELTPIFGTIGDEANFIDFLSPRWVEMLEFTLSEASRLGLGVDMATGTGWPFGGPWVSEEDASKYMSYTTYTLRTGERLKQRVALSQNPLIRVVPNPTYQKYAQQHPELPGIPAWISQNRRPQASDVAYPISANQNLQAMAIDQIRYPRSMKLQTLMAYSADSQVLDLTSKVDAEGRLNWSAPKGTWTLYAVFEGNHGKMVERAAPGGEGNVIDHFSHAAIQHYLTPFEKAFQGKDLSGLRAFFNDSYEVDDAMGQANWTPAFFAAFAQHRGYDLRQHLPALFSNDQSDRHIRVLSDYRQTVAELLLETFTADWSTWAKSQGKIVRNQGHGSPANILDLYAASDIPETEGTDIIKIKFASSAANVSGKSLASCEAATWLNDHFLSTLADVKQNMDRYFAGGVNHVLYHGTSYSPPGEPWPGRLFYAAIHANPRNPLWTDWATLNGYLTRTQSLLQSGTPDNDVLLYFPIFDAYAFPGKELLQHFDGGEKGMDHLSVKEVADSLQANGYTFDFISDNQILKLTARDGKLITGGRTYRAILIPSCTYMPLEVLEQLHGLARSGVHVLFKGALPQRVPGLANLESREQQFRAVRADAGYFHIGDDLDQLLKVANVRREVMADYGLWFNRRTIDGNTCYFIANWSGKDLDIRVPVASVHPSFVFFDPMQGRTGRAETRRLANGQTEVHLQLLQGATLLLKGADSDLGPAWTYQVPKGAAIPIQGTWNLRFLEGGPVLPAATNVQEPVSWTELADTAAQVFAGTARYTVAFARPAMDAGAWKLDLGRVAESARVRLNGKEVATLVGPRYAVLLPDNLLQPDNLLEIEVSNRMANRIAAMDRKGVAWKKFYNTNFPAHDAVNRGADGLFTAAAWKPFPSGLLGPVTLTPME
ncbi:MAG: glycosyl hydrolase [Haliscomenobacter sp.]